MLQNELNSMGAEIMKKSEILDDIVNRSVRSTIINHSKFICMNKA